MLPSSQLLGTLTYPLKAAPTYRSMKFSPPRVQHWRGSLLLANRIWIRIRNTLACSCIRHGGWVLLVFQKYPEFGSPCKEMAAHFPNVATCAVSMSGLKDNQVLCTAWRVTHLNLICLQIYHIYIMSLGRIIPFYCGRIKLLMIYLPLRPLRYHVHPC